MLTTKGESLWFGEMHDVNMWQFGDPLWQLSRGTVAVGASWTSKHPNSHIKDTLRNIQSHNTTSEQTPMKHAKPWSIILQCVIKISVMWHTEGKWRHSPINQSINCYEICICLNMEFDLIKPISRTISLCKHLRGAEGERECVVVACLENILRVSQCVWGYITGFNWIVLHQCQEVTRYVCRGLSYFWLRAWLSPFFLLP